MNQLNGAPINKGYDIKDKKQETKQDSWQRMQAEMAGSNEPWFAKPESEWTIYNKVPKKIICTNTYESHGNSASSGIYHKHLEEDVRTKLNNKNATQNDVRRFLQTLADDSSLNISVKKNNNICKLSN